MNSIRKINHRHKLIMFKLLSGQSQRKVAKDMSLTETWISLLVNDPLFQEEYQKLVDEVRDKVTDTASEVQEIINLAAPKAAKKIVALMDSDESNVKFKACKSVVDYSDFGQEREKEINKPLIFTKEQWMLIAEGLGE